MVDVIMHAREQHDLVEQGQLICMNDVHFMEMDVESTMTCKDSEYRLVVSFEVSPIYLVSCPRWSCERDVAPW